MAAEIKPETSLSNYVTAADLILNILYVLEIILEVRAFIKPV